MPKKPPPSYPGLTLDTFADAPPLVDVSPRERPVTGRTLKEASEHLMLYVHPAAAKALRRYALDQSSPAAKVKVHDLLLEAVEDWFRRHGLREPVRAETAQRAKAKE
jgi:hypothetical protein